MPSFGAQPLAKGPFLWPRLPVRPRMEPCQCSGRRSTTTTSWIRWKKVMPKYSYIKILCPSKDNFMQLKSKREKMKQMNRKRTPTKLRKIRLSFSEPIDNTNGYWLDLTRSADCQVNLEINPATPTDGCDGIMQWGNGVAFRYEALWTTNISEYIVKDTVQSESANFSTH